MRIQIVTPAPRASVRGNNITAENWSGILTRLGHSVKISTDGLLDPSPTDCLVALHARKSGTAINDFRTAFPGNPIIVCLTGTDIHGDLQRQSFSQTEDVESNFRIATHSLEVADRIVVLEPRCVHRLERRFQSKCTTIIQSATPHNVTKHSVWSHQPTDQIILSVIGHMRPVKDPFRAAIASRQLRGNSKIKIIQVGEAMTDDATDFANSETQTNPRYEWRGSVSNQSAKDLLCQSHATIVSSHYEGGSNVISDAVVNSIPILASRMDASIGLLGEDYAGLFDIANTEQLLELMNQLEAEPGFTETILRQLTTARPQFSPQNELASWEKMLNHIGG